MGQTQSKRSLRSGGGSQSSLGRSESKAALGKTKSGTIRQASSDALAAAPYRPSQEDRQISEAQMYWCAASPTVNTANAHSDEYYVQDPPAKVVDVQTKDLNDSDDECDTPQLKASIPKPEVNSANMLRRTLSRKILQLDTNGKPELIIADISPTAQLALAKSNSTSSLFVQSTLSKPDRNALLRAVSIAIWHDIRASAATEAKTYFSCFNEVESPIIPNPPANYFDAPDVDTVFKFIDRIFTEAELSPEVAVMLLVYLERLVSLTGLTLDGTNWRWVTLGSTTLASKVWDDLAVWNVDFIFKDILPNVTVRDLNRLEREMLVLMQFNMVVRASLYAKYYFELRQVSEEKCKHALPPRPLDRDSAARLEARSVQSEQKARNDAAKLPRMRSCDHFVPKVAPAIIS